MVGDWQLLVGGCGWLKVQREKGTRVSCSKPRARTINVRTCSQPHLLQCPRPDPLLDGTEPHRSHSRLWCVHRHCKGYHVESRRVVTEDRNEEKMVSSTQIRSQGEEVTTMRGSKHRRTSNLRAAGTTGVQFIYAWLLHGI